MSWTAKIAILTVAAAILLAALPAIITKTNRRLELQKPNFQGATIPTGFGLVILFWAAPMLVAVLLLAAISRRDPVAVWFAAAHWRAWIAGAYVVLGFGTLGFFDDVLGDRTSSGLLGHSRKLFREGRVTTGIAKAVGGIIVGYLVVRYPLGRSWPVALLEGAIIALSANAVNLLDLRPGRACAVFLVLGSALAVVQAIAGIFTPLILVIVPTAVIYPLDARGKVMLGDTGSNLLGASLGLSLVDLLSPPALQWITLGILIGIHVIAERYSLTALIEGNRFLRRLDALTGVR